MLMTKTRTKEKSLALFLIFLALSIVFTISLKFVDVEPVGPENGYVGFSKLNAAFHDAFGYNSLLHNTTEYLGYIGAIFPLFFFCMGVYQLFKRKSIKKVDSCIYAAGVFYIVLIIVYELFEKLAINCRPVIIDNIIEPSYPSSHTFLTITFCLSTVLLNTLAYKKYSWAKPMNICAIILAIAIPIGRLFSGVHWLTDIFGGVLIAMTLVYAFEFALLKLRRLTNK